MQNVPPETLTQIRRALRGPEGTFVFDINSNDLFDPDHPGGILFDMISGKRYYRIERDQEFKLNFYHSSPGTGTRVASIDFHQIRPEEKTRIIFAWCPSEIQLVVAPTVHAKGPEIAKGVQSQVDFRVGEDGGVHVVGSAGGEVSGLYFFHGDQAVLQPTALQVWQETLTSLEILSSGKSDVGYTHDLVLCNVTLSLLATGFETYAKERFVELIYEGIEPCSDTLVDGLLGANERKDEAKKNFQSSARERRVSIAEYLVQEGKINFMSYQKCKLAYNKTYGIKFGELGLPDGLLRDLKRYLGYRHKIVHVSPMLACLNLGNTPPDEPVLPGLELAQAAKECFKEFVAKLHDATLALRP